MANELRFDGKVVVVTGAGGGLGRSHALLFASRGAKVVVNDLGGSHKGEGKSSSAADKVVEEIKAAGGQAAANHDSVEDGAKIIQTALDAFGRVDVVINNAGILRDTSFQKMTQEDWDLIYRVHVLGAYRVTAAAWPHLRDQKYGRVIFTSSAAGIYGNFGQANYSTAKLGLHGFSQTLALEGRKNNVLVNTIAPIAGSRMTETVLPKELLDALKPEYVSALVATLCHESSEDTGGLYEVGGGFYAKLRWERTEGATFKLGRDVTPELLKDSWKRVTDFGKSTHPANIAESMAPIMKNVEAGPSKGGNQFIDVDQALGYEFPETTTRYDERDLQLYGLAIGAGQDPLDTKELRFVYENSSDGFIPLPTYAVVPAINNILDQARKGVQAPGLQFGLDRVLHGEQYTEIVRPLPPHQKLTHRSRIKAIYDKGKGAVVVNETKSYDENGDLLAINESATFVRGAGGWGGDRGPSADVNVPPDRKPDAVIEEKTAPNQALLYRLSGDWNPLHADPGFAKAFGFERPILHGLCSFGYAGRHVIKAVAPGGDPRFFKSIKVRFADTVLPGETLITEVWKESPTKAVFRTKVKERDKVVISNAAVELYAEVPKPKAKPAAAAASAGGAAAASVEPLSADIFAGIEAFLKKNAEVAAKVGKVFLFKLSNPDSGWAIDLKRNAVIQGGTDKADCTLELSDADFMAMCTGKADPMKLFSTGKLKISGDIMASQKLDFLKKVDPADVLAAMQKRGGGAEGKSAGAGAGTGAGPAPEVSSGLVFQGIGAWLEAHPDVAQKVNTVFLFKLSQPDSQWTLDLKANKVSQGAQGTPECTLELGDADFIAMTSGQADPMKLFTTGKLKIGGNIMASQKLEFLKKIDKNEVATLLAKKGGGAAPSAGAAPAAAAAKPAAPKQARAPEIFEKLKNRLAENPKLGKELNAVATFVVTDLDRAWTVDGTTEPGSIEEKRAAKPDTVFVLSDATLAALASGTKTAKDLFQRGDLRADGDIRVAHRLGIFNKLI